MLKHYVQALPELINIRSKYAYQQQVCITNSIITKYQMFGFFHFKFMASLYLCNFMPFSVVQPEP